MVTLAERISVTETQVANLDEKLTDLKQDIGKLQRCVNKNRDDLITAISAMKQESNDQHEVLAEKISHLERLRDKYTYLVAGAIAAGGFLLGHSSIIEKILG